MSARIQKYRKTSSFIGLLSVFGGPEGLGVFRTHPLARFGRKAEGGKLFGNEVLHLLLIGFERSQYRPVRFVSGFVDGVEELEERIALEVDFDFRERPRHLTGIRRRIDGRFVDRYEVDVVGIVAIAERRRLIDVETGAFYDETDRRPEVGISEIRNAAFFRGVLRQRDGRDAVSEKRIPEQSDERLAVLPFKQVRGDRIETEVVLDFVAVLQGLLIPLGIVHCVFSVGLGLDFQALRDDAFFAVRIHVVQRIPTVPQTVGNAVLFERSRSVVEVRVLEIEHVQIAAHVVGTRNVFGVFPFLFRQLGGYEIVERFLLRFRERTGESELVFLLETGRFAPNGKERIGSEKRNPHNREGR